MLSASLKFLPQNHHHLRDLTEKIYLVELSGIEPLTSSLLKAERRILNNKKSTPKQKTIDRNSY